MVYADFIDRSLHGLMVFLPIRFFINLSNLRVQKPVECAATNEEGAQSSTTKQTTVSRNLRSYDKESDDAGTTDSSDEVHNCDGLINWLCPKIAHSPFSKPRQ